MSSNASPAARKRIDQQELDAICARHDRLWQARPGGARAVFAWLDLSGLSLVGRNLADADFAAGLGLPQPVVPGADGVQFLLTDAPSGGWRWLARHGSRYGTSALKED